MYGDAPPVVVAVEDELMRHKADLVARAVQRQLLREPTWIVGHNLHRLRKALQRLGITLPIMDPADDPGTPRLGAALVDGDMADALAVASRLGSHDVDVWLGHRHALVGPGNHMLIKAHDDGIRLSVIAPEDIEAQSA